MTFQSPIVEAAVPENIQKAAAILKAGGIVAFPTETVYGLGADAYNLKAVAKIFEVKKRPSFDPLILHVADPADAPALWSEIPAAAYKLMKQFWPGPLTIVLPKSRPVPDIVTAGLPTVAVRMPRHQAALKLIRTLGSPVAAPSANLYGYTSPTTASCVAEELGQGVDLLLDGGPTAVGLESTVIKFVEGSCVLLRPGGVPVEEIEEFVAVSRRPADETLIDSPGLTIQHYAPWTPLILMHKAATAFIAELDELEKAFRRKKKQWPRIGLLAFHEKFSTKSVETVQILSQRKDLYEAAANLFQAIRKLDRMNLDFIFAESFPERNIGLAIMDRLKKASGGKYGLKAINDSDNEKS